MFYVCSQCGLYSEEKDVHCQDGELWSAICPHCGQGHPFRRLPLYVLTGASGAGKSAVGQALIDAQLHDEPWAPDCVVLGQDILWRDEFVDPESGYRAYRNMWLRVARNVGQAGRPVVLCGSAVPEQYEGCPERRYLAEIYYLALICDDDLLRERLFARPGWRRSGSVEFVDRMIAFNGWFRENGQRVEPAITLLDTSTLSVREAAEQVAGWIRSSRGQR